MTFVQSLLSLFKGGAPAKRALTITDERYVTEPDTGAEASSMAGYKLKVAKVNGEWSYWYDNEWTPLSEYGGRGAFVRGDRLIVRKRAA